MKKIHLLTAFALLFIPAIAISQAISWQNTIGGWSYDRLGSIQQTSDGGYIVNGFSSSGIGGDKTESTIGPNFRNDYWVIKTDLNGSIQWQRTIGGDGDDWGVSIMQTADGGYILGGYSDSDISGNKTENNHGAVDFWIVKIDGSGIIQWDNTIGGSSSDVLISIQQTTDGGYILGGQSESNISGDKTENSNGFSDYWIVKLNSLGAIQWQNTIGGNNSDDLFSIIQTNDGGFLVGGISTSNISGDKTESSNGPWDFWIVKTDALGSIQWQNTIGGNNTDDLVSMQQTSDGGYILGGQSKSNISGDKTENCIGFNDYWIVKIDSSGNLQWQNTIGGNQEDNLYSLEQTSDGGYILGGYSQSNISGDKTENTNGMTDFWIVKTDSTGVVQWQNTIGGSDQDNLYSIHQTSDGNFILGGVSESDISGDKTENCQMSTMDYWILKHAGQYNSITGKLFIDTNSNGTQDASELNVINKMVTEITTGSLSFSDQTGNYYVHLPDPGAYTVAPVATNYYNCVPISHNASFTGTLQTDSLNDFAFQPAGVFNDLCVSISPMGPFRPGFLAYYMITYENVGTTTLNPDVIFIPDNNVSFVSALPAPNLISTDSMEWNLGPLSPYQSGSILVTVSVPTGTITGTSIISETRIEPLAGDANPACNQSNWEVFATASLDPNDILVQEDTLYTTQFPNPPYLEYLIRFQNTGNDTAFIVNVLNPIDTFKLELSSLEFMASSHSVSLIWNSWERNMAFRFENILLPDSNVNEPASHGFIRYRIKPKSTLTAGDIITNYAAIYFDFNAPVITNTAFTHIVLPTSLNEISSSEHLVLYPNPANTTLNIETGNLSALNSQLIISDVAGRTVLSKSLPENSTKHNLDISTFSNGIYFVQMIAGETILRGKFLKD